MTDNQIKVIKALENGLPISEAPFDEVASRAGLTVDELIRQILEWKADGTIRRFGAILRHHRAGYDANAMVVWNVPSEKIEAFAEVATSFKNVSHCYQRPSFSGFDYNLYTMIHGRSDSELTQTTEEIAERSGISDYALLRTIAEHKKSSPVYFASVVSPAHSHPPPEEREYHKCSSSIQADATFYNARQPEKSELKGGCS